MTRSAALGLAGGGALLTSYAQLETTANMASERSSG